jgi:rhamnosyl/mannosyltransferase
MVPVPSRHGRTRTREPALARTAGTPADGREARGAPPITEPIRVAHLGKFYPPSPGGIEEHTRTLARAQAALGAEVRVLVVNHATAAGRDATFERVTRTRTAEETDGPVRVTRAGRWASLAKLEVAPGLVAGLRRLARWRPDVWHLHAPNVSMMLAVLASPGIRPLVITHHSDIVRQRLLRHAVHPIETAIYRRAARVLPTSRAYADGSVLLRRFENKVTPVPLGIDREPFANPSPAALAFAGELLTRFGRPLWLCVGRLIYYKGLPVAIGALRQVPGHLLVIGTGPLEGELRAKAQELVVADRVTFHGHATPDQLAGAYRAATALWFPGTARSEAFGLAQVEAMASGCPVINTAIPGSGVAWVCRHDQEGLTVPVNDPSSLAAAAKRLLAETGLREKLVAAGRERAATEFDHRVMASRTLAIYRDLRA